MTDFLLCKDFIYLFLEKGREEEGEKHQCVAASPVHPTGGLACVLSGNRISDPLVCRLVLNPLSHTSQGQLLIFLIFSFLLQNI